MPEGTTQMKNTFTGMVTTYRNQGINHIVRDTLQFRRQLTLIAEFRGESGWNDPINNYMKIELEKLAQTVKRVTYSPGSDDPAAILETRLKEAKDTSKTLKDAYDGKSINTDDVPMPGNTLEFTLDVDLTGAHVDYPQPVPDVIKNDVARTFIQTLDQFCVLSTRLDSRVQVSTINAAESAQLLAVLNSLYAICMLRGGEKNKSLIPSGVLPSEEPTTFNANGQFDPQLAAK